jgi:hypothetical protein
MGYQEDAARQDDLYLTPHIALCIIMCEVYYGNKFSD